MVVKLYISGISGNKEVKKKQQRVQMILDSKQISYEAIDITEPGKEKDKEFMQQNGKVRESLGKHPLPPQIFNDDSFCGDYDDFDLANEVDELEKFLLIQSKDLENGSKVNGMLEEVIDVKKPDEETKFSEENCKVNGVDDDSHTLEPPCDTEEEIKDDAYVDSNPPRFSEIMDEIKDDVCPDNNGSPANEELPVVSAEEKIENDAEDPEPIENEIMGEPEQVEEENVSDEDEDESEDEKEQDD